jgi:hypothetical protein
MIQFDSTDTQIWAKAVLENDDQDVAQNNGYLEPHLYYVKFEI